MSKSMDRQRQRPQGLSNVKIRRIFGYFTNVHEINSVRIDLLLHKNRRLMCICG